MNDNQYFVNALRCFLKLGPLYGTLVSRSDDWLPTIEDGNRRVQMGGGRLSADHGGRRSQRTNGRKITRFGTEEA